MLGARQRDVGEAKVLPALFLEVLLLVAAEVGALQPHVDHPLVAARRVVVGHRHGLLSTQVDSHRKGR